MQRAKSKTSVLERDIEEADAESIARLAQFLLLSSMVGRHDKPWYANAVEQLPNVEMTHSKAIQLKLFFYTNSWKLYHAFVVNIWPGQPRVSRLKARITFRNLSSSFFMSFGKRSWGRMVHAVLTKPAKLIRAKTRPIRRGVWTVGAEELKERTEISDFNSWSTTAASSSLPWKTQNLTNVWKNGWGSQVSGRKQPHCPNQVYVDRCTSCVYCLLA